MRDRTTKKSNKLLVFTVCFSFIVTVIIAVFMMHHEKAEMKPSPKTVPQEKIKKGVIKRGPVIDIDKLDKDPALTALMDKRKSKYGLTEGLDMIVKPNESLKVAGRMIPMEEILDKIKIKKGELIESDLAPEQTSSLSQEIAQAKKIGISVLKEEISERAEQFLTNRDNPKGIDLIAKSDDAVRIEAAEVPITTVMKALGKKKKIETELPPDPTFAFFIIPKGRLASDQAIIKRMHPFSGETVEPIIVDPDEILTIDHVKISMRELVQKIQAAQSERARGETEEYGIYVVQPKDNIWNIHFRLLKKYFESKQVTLSPLADEPEINGMSTGIGKLLKFSEKMVSIYNLTENRIDMNIHSIEPSSKVVIYNMKEVFALLEEIDYDNINHIMFDGETIWLPADH